MRSAVAAYPLLLVALCCGMAALVGLRPTGDQVVGFVLVCACVLLGALTLAAALGGSS